MRDGEHSSTIRERSALDIYSYITQVIERMAFIQP
jgi:hypothetical protein